jgi:hypothetical protein
MLLQTGKGFFTDGLGLPLEGCIYSEIVSLSTEMSHGPYVFN